jgi:signal transduction histidine kinase
MLSAWIKAALLVCGRFSFMASCFLAMGNGSAAALGDVSVSSQELLGDRSALKPLPSPEPLSPKTATLSGLVRYDGTLEGPIIVQAWKAAPGNRALKLDGNGDYVITALTDLSGPELTLQFWFKGDSMQSAVRQQNGNLEDLENEWSGRTNKASLDPPRKGWIVASWNQFFILSHDGLLSGVYGTPAATNGHWHHVTMTWKQNAKGGFASYLDGQLVTRRDSRNVAIPNYDAPVFFGARDGFREFTQGQLDEIAIWKRAWPEEEVHTHWNQKLTGKESGLAGLWNFDDGSATDASSHHYQGSFNGDACAVDADIPGLGAPVCYARLDQPGPYQLTNLLAGVEYRVIAFLDLNGDGGWNPGEPCGGIPGGAPLLAGNLARVNLRLSLPVSFWRSWPFYLIGSMAALAMIGGLIRAVEKRRIHRRYEALERLHLLEKERARIARDIHDDVGSSLTRIAWLSQMAEKDKHEPEKIESHTRKIAACARQMIQALDEIVWAVNPGNDSLRSLAQYISHHAHECLGESAVGFRLKIPDDLPDVWLSSEVRHGLFLAVKEALNNALKHAAATEIVIALGVERSILTIQIEDNGRGFDLAAQSSDRRGNGLDNIRRRIEDLAGAFHWESVASSGTKLAMTVKLGAAPACV